MQDPTETIRRQQQAQINSEQATRETLEKRYGTVYSTEELREKFEVLGCMAPYVVVRDKATGEKGSLMFSHSPRFYFGFQVD